MFDIFHDCNRSTFDPTHKYSSLRLPEISPDPNLHNFVLSQTSWDRLWQVVLVLVPGGLDLITDPSLTHHGKEKKKKIGHSCLLLVPGSLKPVSDHASMSQTGLVFNRITIVA